MTIQERILQIGADDWFYLAEISDLVRNNLPNHSEEEIIKTTLFVIENLVRNELIEIGGLVEGRGFCAWPLTLDESLKKIEREWQKLHNANKQPNIGDVCWMANTSKGDAQAAKLPPIKKTPISVDKLITIKDVFTEE